MNRLFTLTAYLQGMSFRLAVSVIQNCSEKLEPSIRCFLTSSILNRDASTYELNKYYHEIILEIFQCAPQILIAVIPNLTQELIVCNPLTKIEPEIVLICGLHLGVKSFVLIFSPHILI